MGNKRGFTLVELIVVMAIFIIVMIITTNAFENILRVGGQQTKSAASQIEGIVGLEMLRKDLANAGYGLPWEFEEAKVPYAYKEVESTPAADLDFDASDLNDVPPALPKEVITAATGADASCPGSHYLVLKSALLPLKTANSSVGRWGYINYSSATNVNRITGVGDSEADLRDSGSKKDRVITIRSQFVDTEQRKFLVMSATGGDDDNFSYVVPDGFHPPAGFQLHDRSDTLVVYGISDTANIRMPYNRADYYISRPPASDPDFKFPDYCNPGTGILFKAVADQAGGYVSNIYPLLNCVGDMRVVYYLDMNQPDPDGIPGTYANAANGSYFSSDEGTSADSIKSVIGDLTSGKKGDAKELRERLKSVNVYFLTHEGRKDPGYSYPVSDPSSVIVVGPADMPSLGKIWTETEMKTQFGNDWRNYRWKVYSIQVNK